MSIPLNTGGARAYRALADGLRDMIEGGRLEESMIPDDYEWLVGTLSSLARGDPAGDVDDKFIRQVNKDKITDIHGEFTFGGEKFRDPESGKWAIFDIDGDRVTFVDTSMVKVETLSLAWSVWNVAKDLGQQLGEARVRAGIRQLLGL